MRVYRPLCLCLLATLAACNQLPEPAPEKARPPAVSIQPDAPPEIAEVAQAGQVSSLAGAWRVAGIDGRSFDEPYGLALSGDDRQVVWEPRCAGFAREYRIEGRSITFAPTGPATPPGTPTAPVCSIGVPPRLGEVFRALDNAVSVSRTAGNGVLISGQGHSVTLFSQ